MLEFYFRGKHLLRAIVALILIAGATPSIAQMTRIIPADARRGSIAHIGESVVRVNGTPALLAASARIMSRDNLTIVPSAIPPNSVARYQVDANGHISRIWILTEHEVAQRDPRP